MSLDLPGFADPVREAQSCFRAVLEAMSRPGRIVNVGEGLTPPASLGPAAAATLLTLLDADTSLWMEEDAAPVREWLAFHCGTNFAPLERARFALARTLPDLAMLDNGTDEEPETSATLIVEVTALGSGRALQLAGPGLAGLTAFAVDGLASDFVPRWAENHARFPRGVDLILCAGTALAALPRSVQIAEG
jgi:alpha-D-ribose 1-methylphosphonate 5-triphosphate synthase subunit PhnH